MTPIILIPARLASTRLPNKMLKEINGLPLISQVVKRALEADIGPVHVACDSPEIQEVVTKAGARGVLTDPGLPSGSDRIFKALQEVDPQKKFDTIINVQGDLPNISSKIIKASLDPLKEERFDVATLGVEIHSQEDLMNPNIVKIALAHRENGRHEALYFSRAPIPTGAGPHYHHIGLYTYRRPALERFVELPPSPLEVQEKLEQLRVLENDMRIGVALVDEVPLSIDTAEDLNKARKIMA
ncbi:MAG TPA: 3-deoxy-manno-octulosonate cytidylyltransferase [Holosporales bacterium]|nr:3-deoxy-manno-octulosonate cytidylyltransferase [Holosporales bacterium]